MDARIEELVKIFGEHHRSLIVDAMKFLWEHEPSWNLDTPIEPVEYIREILDSCKKL